MYRLLNPLSFVACKMGRLRGGPSRRAYLAHSTRRRLLRAFDALPHAARVKCIRRLCVGWLAVGKRQRVEWVILSIRFLKPRWFNRSALLIYGIP
jgi:hypothetical protein